ncbi:MAG: hypothetical protein JNL08_10170 [Planctomycetes bacterium]|nr:hypothetical protein [Planctomycetota bacterium]
MTLRSFGSVLALAAALVAQDPRRSPPPAPGGAAPRTAQQQVERLLTAVRDGDAVALWDWLPPSYQQDVEGLAHALANRVDAKTWNRGAKLLHRLAAAAAAKQQFVFGNRTVADQLRRNGTDARSVQAAWTALTQLLQQLATSDLGSVEGLRDFDGRAFTQRSGTALLETVFALARASGHDPLADLDAVQVRTVGQQGGEVRIELDSPQRGTEVTTFVQVEGRWLPAPMARGWQDGIAELHDRLAALPHGGDARTAAQAGLLLGALEGFVKQLEDVESQADFDALCTRTLQMLAPRPEATPARHG